MADAFISYQRKPSASLALLIEEKLKNQYDIDCFVDVSDTDNTQVQFPEKLMRAIDNAPAFICLLGDTTLESEWVLEEIRKAHKLQKFCIPVFQEGYDAPQNPEKAVNYLLKFDGVYIFDRKNIYIDNAIEEIANRIHTKSLRWTDYLPAIAGILLLLVLATWGINSLIRQMSDRVVEGVQTAQVPGNISTETGIIPTVDPLQLATDGVTDNEQWTAFTRQFNDIDMMLVPTGCFMMGSSDEQIEYALEIGGERDWFINEQAVTEICFDTPFWIDKTEVTQADFERLNGEQLTSSNFADANRPVETITWLEAQGFCESRGGRLPTESEWEYAARGVDGLIFPWGNAWNPDNPIWNRDASDGTAIVGSIPAGASWIGALDMSGNVWEWTDTLYESEGEDVLYIVRGSSWDNSNASFMRTALRFSVTRTLNVNTIGFRCVRDFNPDE